MKVLHTMSRNRCWPTAYYIVTTGYADKWYHNWPICSCANHTNFPSTYGCEIVKDATTAKCQVVRTSISVCPTSLL